MKKRILVGILVALIVVLGGAGGVGWYYSNVLKDGALVVNDQPAAPDLVVASVEGERITLETTDATDLEYGNWKRPGEWGLAWDGGYARVGEIVELKDNSVTRRFEPLPDIPAAGMKVRVDGTAFEGNPLSARGLSFQEVSYPGELGTLHAWFIPGTSSTWAIFTHGMGQTPKESLRFLPPLANAGLPILAISYRNDTGSPASRSGYYEYGETEWRDLEAAVQYALDGGANDIVLYGVSMGGAITVSFLYHSELAGKVRAVILDAPATDFSDEINLGAEHRNLPGPVTWIGKLVSSWRFGFKWTDRDFISHVERLKVPVLVFHGDADRSVPIRLTERLAAAQPDRVTFLRVPGASHLTSWNTNPVAYEDAISAFLARVLGPTPPPAVSPG